MRRLAGPDFSGIREAMERIALIKRRMDPPDLSVDTFEEELDQALKAQKTPVASETDKKNMPSLTGSGSIVQSRLGAIPDEELNRIIADLSTKYGVDEKLVRSVISVESAWRHDAVSPKGAMGLMQLMPGTARMLGVDPKDPAQNVEGGVKYLSQLSEKYGGDLEKTLAAYNAGPGRVDSYGGIPPFKETEAYVRRVLRLYEG